jgi:integrase
MARDLQTVTTRTLTAAQFMRSEAGRIGTMLTIWRRHTSACPHRAKGRAYLKCSCPLWADGYVDDKRILRQSLETRDFARARKRAVELESPDRRIFKPVAEAVTAFIDHCESESLRTSTVRKYRNTLTQLQAFCAGRSIDTIGELTADHLDAFRANRALKPITSAKELQLLRQFCGFCLARQWASEIAAARIKAPRNIKPNDVEPFTAGEIAEIIRACDGIGRTSYERARARAMVLLLRFTALRIGDVAMLARDRVSRTGNAGASFCGPRKAASRCFCRSPMN